MGSQAGLWLVILTAAIAVGVAFLVPVVIELRRSAKRLTAVLTIAEHSLGPLLRDLDGAVQRLDRVTDNIGEVTDDVRMVSGSARRFGRTVGELGALVLVSGLGFGAARAAVRVAKRTGRT